MKTIIVATDFSPGAENATEYAAALAQRTGSGILLYHAYHLTIPTEVSMVAPDIEVLSESFLEKLNNQASKLRKRHAIDIKTYTSSASLIDELPGLVSEYNADLVVMGMKKDVSFERKIFGSTIASILHLTKFPLLIVPEKASFKDFKDIVFAYDCRILSSRNKLNVLKDLAQELNSKIHVVHIGEQDLAVKSTRSDRATSLETSLKGTQFSFSNYDEKSTIKGIEKSVHDLKADLVVMVPREPDFMDILLGRSNTKKIAYKSKIPLLAIPNPI